MNFEFLKREDDYYALFADACLDAERIFATSPAMCAIGCRKALELAVKWVYAADNTIRMPYKDNLSSLIHEETFKACVDAQVWRRLPMITKLGNLAVHTGKTIKPQQVILSLIALFDFVDWIDYCYGPDYHERAFDEKLIPPAGIPLTPDMVRAIKQRESLMAEQHEKIKALEAQVAEMSDRLTEEKQERRESRTFNPDDLSEFETRRLYIDTDLEIAGWDFSDNVVREREVLGMPVEPGNNTGKGFVDYLLLGKDGKPLAIVEAKRTIHDPQKGLQQARLYADCLNAEFGYRPLIFLANGFETYFVDDESAPMRQVSGVFSRDELQTILLRRDKVIPLSTVKINEDIAGRYYQMRAIRKVCAAFDAGQRKALLVMATGTGKTRVSAALADGLMRGNRVKNVLFLADRIALVRQAKAAYQEYLPQTSLCNLCSNKDDRDARIVFSTYPTILNAIDSVRSDDGIRLFTPAHFDLIIIDEAHRSIFNKYRAIFEYFDALLVGLTATPANEVDRNTYDFFEVQRGVPTDVYEYKTAVEVDHWLVPYLRISTHTTFLDEGITYDDLSEEDKERIEEDFDEVGEDVPDHIAPTAIDEWLFNRETVDNVLQKLMSDGIKVDGGERLGKTIIFAANRAHAQFIVERFEKLYPDKATGGFIRRVVHSDDYAPTIIDDFKLKEKPVITVSVDMMDTGIDVPEIVNLVFFKKVRSRVKFWQMIGRGTRLCPELDVVDPLDQAHAGGESHGKQRFFIFDWCRNFEFFSEGGKEVEGKMAGSLSELVFQRQAQLAVYFQDAAYADEAWQDWRGELVEELHYQVVYLDEHEGDLINVRLQRRAMERFKQKSAFDFIDQLGLGMLQTDIAPLVHEKDDDIAALRFDALMYGFMCSLCDGASVKTYKRRLVGIALGLQKMITLPQVQEKLPILQEVTEERFYDRISALNLERVRKELRSIIQFLVKQQRPVIYTDLSDPVTDSEYGSEIMPDEDFTDYKLKVNRYFRDYADNLVIQKLRLNRPMTEVEYRELERIFTQELGNEQDYASAYGSTPFGLLVRKIVKLDHEAAMQAFAEFLNDETLTEQQIAFVNKVVDYVENNGYMEPSALGQAPFDRPQSFVRLFDPHRQRRLMEIITTIKQNAESPAA